MVAPVAKYKFWANADYNGLGTASTDFWPSIEAELDSWITAITNNASLTNAVPIKRKGVADSTDSNHLGFVVECPHPTAGTIYAGSHSTATNNRVVRAWSVWNDDGSSGGYGSGTAIDGESCSWSSSGYDQGIMLAYDTTDEKEFFMAGVYSSQGTSYQDMLICIMRGASGHWGTFINDTATEHVSWYSQTDAAYKSATVDFNTETFEPLISQRAAPYSIGPGSVFVPANERIRGVKNYTTGAYFGYSPYSVYAMAYYGPLVVIGN